MPLKWRANDGPVLWYLDLWYLESLSSLKKKREKEKMLSKFYLLWQNFLDPCMFNPFKLRKKSKIRNRYNQVPHLTQDTNGKVTKNKNITYRRAKASAFYTAADHKAARHRQDNMTKTNTNKINPQKKYHLGTVSKKITGGLKLVSRYQPHP